MSLTHVGGFKASCALHIRGLTTILLNKVFKLKCKIKKELKTQLVQFDEDKFFSFNFSSMYKMVYILILFSTNVIVIAIHIWATDLL